MSHRVRRRCGSTWLLRLVPFLPCVLLAACDPASPRDVYVRGAIEGARVTEARIGAQASPIDARGRFAIPLDVERPGYVELQVGERIPLFVSPGDQVSLSATASNLLGTLEFSGANAHINRYLAESMRIGQSEVDFRRLFALPEDRFLEETTALEARFAQRFADFFAAHHTVHREFARLEPEAIRYTWAEVRLHYPGLAKRFTATPPDPPQGDFDRYLATLDFNDASLLALKPYGTFLESYLDQKAHLALTESRTVGSLDHQLMRARLEVALATFTDSTVKNRMLHDLMKRQILEFGMDGADDLLAIFDEHCDDPTLRGAIDSLAVAQRKRTTQEPH